MTTTLVLGAGGTVGLAYHAGALRALARHAQFSPSDADLIIGTSAGAVIGAYLRAGWEAEDLWRAAIETPPETADRVFTPSFRSPLGLARRMLGTSYVLARSAVRFPAPRLPSVLQRAFPGGMFRLAAGQDRLAAELPAAWPSRPLWLCTVDLTSGRRVVLGRNGAPRDLHAAVLASCAIPGVYPPVRIGRQTLVDGGLHSSTNLDLVVEAADPSPSGQVICIAPMAFDTARPPGAASQLMRRLAARQLSAEAAAVRQAGTQVLLVRPTAAEVRLHGPNYMRLSGWDRIARAAYDATSRLLEERSFDHGRGSSAATTL